MVTEAHVIDPVLLGWDQADRVASEGATDFKHLSLKMDFAFLLNFADGDPRVVLNRRQALGIDIGRPSRAFPVTPPCVRVRTRRFGSVERSSDGQSGQA